MEGKLTNSLQRLFKHLGGTTKTAHDPSSMLHVMIQIDDGAKYRDLEQQDAHEVLNFLLNGLDEENKGTALLTLLFQGKLCSKVQCLGCSNASKREEDFWTLELDFIKALGTGSSTDRVSRFEGTDKILVRLEDLLRSFTRIESLSGENLYDCSGCGQKQAATKQLTICSPPSTLILHLKRFSFQEYGKKLESPVSFPQDLDLREVGLMEDGSRSDTSYYIRAVIVHKGPTLTEGHYISYARYRETGSWFCYNDSEVHQVKFEQVQKEQAYMLFYDQMVP